MTNNTKRVLQSLSAGIGGPAAIFSVLEGDRFAAMDQFLDANLFLGLMGITLSAAALLLVVAEQTEASARSILAGFDLDSEDHAKENKKAVEARFKKKRAHLIKSSAIGLFWSFGAALLGLISTIGFDALLESDLGQEGPLNLINVVSNFPGLPEEVYEALISSSFLAATLTLMVFSVLRAMKAIIADQEKM